MLRCPRVAVFFAIALMATIFPPGAYAQGEAPQLIVEQANGAIEETKTTLSQVDGALEFPMSEPEKTQSQTQLDAAKTQLTAEIAAAANLGSIRETARQARDLARQAIEAARSGDRQKALTHFTAARIKLQEARWLLSQTPAATEPVLQGRAEKDQLPATTTAPATPHQQKAMSAHPGTTSKQAIPAGQSGDPGLVVRGDGETVTIRPGGVFVQPSSSSPSVIVGSPGVSVTSPAGSKGFSDRGGDYSAYPMDWGSGRGAGRQAGRPGGGGISISPDGITIGGRQIISGGGGAISITPGGINVGADVSSGDGIVIAGHNQSPTIDCNGKNVMITGHDNRVRLTGRCAHLSVTGHHNNVSVQTVVRITATGHDNSVIWSAGADGRSPAIVNTGRANEINQAR